MNDTGHHILVVDDHRDIRFSKQDRNNYRESGRFNCHAVADELELR